MPNYVLTASLIVLSLISQLTANQAQGQTTATKFDEFGDVLYSDLIARLDNFAVQLQNQPETLGFVMVYRSRRDPPGLNHALGLRMRDYLVKTRGLPKTRVIIVDGGVADHLIQELWVVPPGTAPKPREDVHIGAFPYSDSAWKFFEYHYNTQEEWTRFGYGKLDNSDADHLEAFANEVKKNSGYTACIIAYAQYNRRPPLVDYTGDYLPKRATHLDGPETAPRRLALEKGLLTKIYGIPPEKIRTINGGYRKRRVVELWIVPPDEPLPVPTPNSFPPKKKER